MKTIYVTIAVQISEDAEEVVNEMDYNLKHEDILNTEVQGYEESA